MSYTDLYLPALPQELRAMAETDAMTRLAHVGMHCGCEYTAYPLYISSVPYSRLTHSLGVAALVWRFTGSLAQSAAGLLHDVATPVFAHVVDFLHGDHLRQESTESRTRAMIAASEELMRLLAQCGLTLDDVADYHRYPIADNDSPRLSADRLEYTLGNARLVFHEPEDALHALVDDLFIGENEDGAAELSFFHDAAAEYFTRLALRQSRWFVSDDDRFAMQYLADLLRDAQRRGVLTEDALYRTEPPVIARLLADEALAARWNAFRRITGTQSGKTPPDGVYAVRVAAKKRSIDPLVQTPDGLRRFSALSADYAAQLAVFRADEFDRFVWGVEA